MAEDVTQSEELSDLIDSELEAADGDEVLPASDDDLGIVARICALLFVSTRPLTTLAIARAARTRKDDAELALEQVGEMFRDEEHGFSLKEINGAWEFRTAPAAADTIKRLVPQKGRRLSRAAAETLAVIAYKQPVQRAEIEAIRGVDALPTLKTLLDGKLVRIVGREDAPGHPALYGTTDKFLTKFGLCDLSELPSIRELEQLSSEPGENAELGEDSDDDSDDEDLAFNDADFDADLGIAAGDNEDSTEQHDLG